MRKISYHAYAFSFLTFTNSKKDNNSSTSVSVNMKAPHKYKQNAVWKSIYAEYQFIDKNIPKSTPSKVKSLRLRFPSTSLFNFRSLSFHFFQLKCISLSYISKCLRVSKWQSCDRILIASW